MYLSRGNIKLSYRKEKFAQHLSANRGVHSYQDEDLLGFGTIAYVLFFFSFRINSLDNMARPRKWKNFMSDNMLTMLTVLGVIAGVILGFILRNARSEPWSKREIMYIQFPGDIFLRMLKALILPLIVASIVSAIGGLDLNLSGN